jgi:hypothetical protein
MKAFASIDFGDTTALLIELYPAELLEEVCGK